MPRYMHAACSEQEFGPPLSQWRAFLGVNSGGSRRPVQYAYFVDDKNPEYKAPWNHLKNIPRVCTPADTAIQTPNSDTPYSMIGMGLRAEPMVLTVSAIEKARYFSIQLIDAYTFNFDYAGSRTTGNDGGSFLVAGPGQKGESPTGIKRCFARRPISSSRPIARSCSILATWTM